MRRLRRSTSRLVQSRAADARRDPELGQVIEYGSRGSSVLSQFTAAVMWHPWETIVPRFSPYHRVKTRVDLAYTHTEGTASVSGFQLGSGRSPARPTNGRAGVPRHNIQFGGEVSVDGWFTLQTALRLSSGNPFTPVVGADINGDGFRNDPAFVFDRGGDSATASVGAAIDALTRTFSSIDLQVPLEATPGAWRSPMCARGHGRSRMARCG